VSRDPFPWIFGGVGLIGLVLIVILIFFRSANNAVTVEQTNNPDVKSEVLFTDAEGYTVKRFYDNGRYHYYVLPAGEVHEAQVEQSGKTQTTKYHSVPTVKKK
jgi:hypothetical protein